METNQEKELGLKSMEGTAVLHLKKKFNKIFQANIVKE